MEYITRDLENKVRQSLEANPVTAILGPRQCGKSTLALHVLKDYHEALYLDLERPSDLLKLNNAEWFLSGNRHRLICMDEIQRKPELFPLIRSLTDEWQGVGHFLILGSSSRDLLKQSSESLAGRVSYLHLSPFIFEEIASKLSLEEYLVRGGFPRSTLSDSSILSHAWLNDFISTFLERDLLQYSGFAPLVMRRLWQMMAHNNGQTVNYSALGNSLGVSNVTIKNYLDLLEGTFMIDVLQPWHSNLKKRIIKAPKIYISDAGITTALLGLSDFNQLAGHIALGSVWEQVVLSQLKSTFPLAAYSFYRTAGGAETDIVMEYKGLRFAIECKISKSPQLTKGNYSAITDIQPIHSFVVAPVREGWPANENQDIVNLSELKEKLTSYI
jgi:predicted AAA+ superfamily ATPase